MSFVAQRSRQRSNGSTAARDGARKEAERAEQLLEGLGARAGSFGQRAGSFLASAAARAREEAEDIWAEAQSIRRGQRS